MSRSGSGIAFVCGDQILLLKGSSNVGSPGTWAPPGGNVENGETPLDAAIRESDEEILNVPSRYVITGEYQFKNPSIDYTMYVAHVLRKFKPKLNWENTDSSWVKISQVDKYELHPDFRLGIEKIRRMDNAVS